MLLKSEKNEKKFLKGADVACGRNKYVVTYNIYVQEAQLIIMEEDKNE